MVEGSGTTPPKGSGQRGGGRTPVDSKTRARVRKLARGGKSRNAIARELHLSTSTVSRICAEAKPPIAFAGRPMVAAATETIMVDLKARRAALSVTMLDEVDRLVSKLTASHVLTHFDKEGFMHSGYIDGPQSGDVKNYATSIGILLDKHLVLVRTDSDDRDLPAVDQWLDAMMRGGAA